MDIVQRIEQVCGLKVKAAVDQPVIELEPADLIVVAKTLKRHNDLQFNMLLDVCVVDYLSYGQSNWSSTDTSAEGFGRAKAALMPKDSQWTKPRFAVVYHLLSIKHNVRLRLKVWADGQLPLQSVSAIWASAIWYEREAFDLFGIQFEGHPDLRRILTDYGFVGYPMRKDFPLIGYTEIRYDGQSEKCVYDQVSIEYRSHVPRVIRQDHRYWEASDGE